MYSRNYCNYFVPSSLLKEDYVAANKLLNGEKVKQMYLEEIINDKKRQPSISLDEYAQVNIKPKVEEHSYTVKDLLLAAQNDDVNIICSVLCNEPEKVNTLDEFGWSLLMIACQANAVETVKVLLKYNADTNVRDKAGHSAQSLVIKSKNYVLADILLNCGKEILVKKIDGDGKQKYNCDLCGNKMFPDKLEHLSSTIHNINTSKKIKQKPAYKIPQNNRGYQIMVKRGWDRSSGLGPDGSGTKYPLRTIQKLDRTGLGLKKSIPQKTEDLVKKQNIIPRDQRRRDKQLEIKYRRQFY